MKEASLGCSFCFRQIHRRSDMHRLSTFVSKALWQDGPELTELGFAVRIQSLRHGFCCTNSRLAT